MIKILIVDDQKEIRVNLVNLLKPFQSLKIVGSAHDGNDAILKTKTFKPDVILMDIRMPEADGIYATQKIKSTDPNIKIIMLTTFVEDELVIEAMKAGANGYLLKDISIDDLVQAIVVSEKGYSQIPNKIITSLYKNKSSKIASSKLSNREEEILSLIATGASNQEIADILKISVKTVKNHITNILKILNLRDRTQAAIYAISLAES